MQGASLESRRPLHFPRPPLYAVDAVSVAEACKALKSSLAALRAQGERVLGFDIEWRPEFRKGVPQPKAATLQLATKNVAAVFHLSRFPCITEPPVAELLAEPGILKVGARALCDAEKLCRDYGENGMEIRGVYELETLLNKIGIFKTPLKSTSLAKLCHIVLRRDLASPVQLRCSNWETPELSRAQLEYAATEAWASALIFTVLYRHSPEIVTDAVQQRSMAVAPASRSQKRSASSIECGAGLTSAFSEVSGLPPAKREVHRLFAEDHMGPAMIAQRQGLKLSTVLDYLVDAVAAGYEYRLTDFPLDNEDQEVIAVALKNAGSSVKNLKQIKEALPSNIEYWAIKLMRAHLARSASQDSSKSADTAC